MKIAIVHEMLVKLGWAEKVVETWMNMFPDAAIFTLIYDEVKTGSIFPRSKIHPQVFSLKTQKLYKITWAQRLCLPLMSQAIESFDLSHYDLVLVSSSGFAHGVITKPETQVITYSHSPMRYLWDWTNEYKNDIWWNRWIKAYILNRLFLKLRQWDYMAGQRSDIILANSSNTAQRVKKYYRREASILHPPVEIARFSFQNAPASYFERASDESYYIIISALTAFKRLEIAITAFNKMPDKKLKIIWSGDYEKYLKNMSQDNIEFSWRIWGDDLVYMVAGSLGLIFPGEEDFGIVPIEVMAAWKPVFALSKWWLLETVIAWKTGEFFNNPRGEDFIEKFEIFHKNNIAWNYLAQDCFKQAEKFDTHLFEEKLETYIINKRSFSK